MDSYYGMETILESPDASPEMVARPFIKPNIPFLAIGNNSKLVGFYASKQFEDTSSEFVDSVRKQVSVHVKDFTDNSKPVKSTDRLTPPNVFPSMSQNLPSGYVNNRLLNSISERIESLPRSINAPGNGQPAAFRLTIYPKGVKTFSIIQPSEKASLPRVWASPREVEKTPQKIDIDKELEPRCCIIQ